MKFILPIKVLREATVPVQGHEILTLQKDLRSSWHS